MKIVRKSFKCLGYLPIALTLGCKTPLDANPPPPDTPDILACHVAIARCAKVVKEGGEWVCDDDKVFEDEDGEPILEEINKSITFCVEAGLSTSEKKERCEEESCDRKHFLAYDYPRLDSDHCKGELAIGEWEDPSFGPDALQPDTCHTGMQRYILSGFEGYEGAQVATDLGVELIGNVAATIEGQDENLGILRGGLSLRSPDFECAADCKLAVTDLWVEFEDFSFKGHEVSDLRISLPAPFPLEAGLRVGPLVMFATPPGAPLTATGKIDGAPTVDGFIVNGIVFGTYLPASGTLTMSFSFAGEFSGLNVSGSLSVASNVVTNLPPQADAGADLVMQTSPLSCTAAIPLDASASVDNVGEIRTWRWADRERVVATDESTFVELAPGETILSLVVTDVGGSVSSDSLVVQVEDKSAPSVECSNVQVECTGPSTPVATSCTANDACEGAIEPENHALDSYELGHHTYECEAADSAGNDGSDTCTVDIIDSVPPVFTFVPPDLTITSCENANIGQALVSDLCGPVLVSNDAPAKFPLGETIVTWRALDHGNNQIEATQRVTAILGDDPSCCPEGTTIKVGTAGNDVITGTNGPDCLLGLGGIDRISAKGGNDFVSGGDGNDIIDAMSGNNVVHGGAGNDQISTGPGNDIVVGHAGDDVCDAGLGTNAVSCEVAANCTAACCATNTCDDDVLDPNACGATYSQGSCLSFIQGSVVERNGHNWLCSDGNCRNCASHSSCAPGGTGCPWGVVWTDLGACN